MELYPFPKRKCCIHTHNYQISRVYQCVFCLFINWLWKSNSNLYCLIKRDDKALPMLINWLLKNRFWEYLINLWSIRNGRSLAAHPSKTGKGDHWKDTGTLKAFTVARSDSSEILHGHIRVKLYRVPFVFRHYVYYLTCYMSLEFELRLKYIMIIFIRPRKDRSYFIVAMFVRPSVWRHLSVRVSVPRRTFI